MRNVADKVRETAQDTGQRPVAPLDRAEAEDVLRPLTVSTQAGKLFAGEHAALIGGVGATDYMIQLNIARYLQGSHMLCDQPDSPDNKWRVFRRPPPPTSLWRALPCVSDGTRTGANPKAAPASTTTHSNMASCTFWLLATGFDVDRRNVFCDLVRSPDELSVCPYFGIEYREKDSELEQALEHLVTTASHALYDRVLLRKAAAKAKDRSQDCEPAVDGDDVISYYGITLSQTSYKVYRIAAYNHRITDARGRRLQQEHHHPQPIPASGCLPIAPSASTSNPGVVPAKHSGSGISSCSSRNLRTTRQDGHSTQTPKGNGNSGTLVSNPPRCRPVSTPSARPGCTGSATSVGVSHHSTTDDKDPWVGCEVARIGYGGCRNVPSLLRLVDWVNEIHKWGQSEHAASVTADLATYIDCWYGERPQGMES